MKLQRSYHKEVQQIAAHCGIEGSVPLSPPNSTNGNLTGSHFSYLITSTLLV